MRLLMVEITTVCLKVTLRSKSFSLERHLLFHITHAEGVAEEGTITRWREERGGAVRENELRGLQLHINGLCSTSETRGEQLNPAGVVDQGSKGFKLLMGKPCGGSTGGGHFYCLSPPHAYAMGVKYMTGWVSMSGTVGSNLKSETQTAAKILWI
ncbi:hypothetical protein TNCV_935491 [Trichonephila clavipes]|nr:hypothetical protein TNCV_935491 [Trichonephila clavipes]